MSVKQIEKVSVIPADEPSALVAITPMVMLEKALTSGASMEVLEKFMALSERWEANQARKSFDEAVSMAKAKIPPIQRNATGHNEKRYANFAAIAQVVDPILSECGLSYRFRTSQTDRIAVTCILSHKAGHHEETTLSGPADSSGNKNAIQAIGSTLTYLQRYSLVQMLGLAAAADDDGKAGTSGNSITQAQADQIVDLLESLGADRGKFLAWAKRDRIEDIPADKFDMCISTIKARAPKS